MQKIPDELEAHVRAGEEGKRFFARYYNSALEGPTHLTTFTDMDIDPAKQIGSTAGLVSRSTRRVQKRGHGKARAAMVFPIHDKGKRMGARLSARERKKSLKP